jgi:hypothetical protein
MKDPCPFPQNFIKALNMSDTAYNVSKHWFYQVRDFYLNVDVATKPSMNGLQMAGTSESDTGIWSFAVWESLVTTRKQLVSIYLIATSSIITNHLPLPFHIFSYPVYSGCIRGPNLFKPGYHKSQQNAIFECFSYFDFSLPLVKQNWIDSCQVNMST